MPPAQVEQFSLQALILDMQSVAGSELAGIEHAIRLVNDTQIFAITTTIPSGPHESTNNTSDHLPLDIPISSLFNKSTTQMCDTTNNDDDNQQELNEVSLPTITNVLHSSNAMNTSNNTFDSIPTTMIVTKEQQKLFPDTENIPNRIQQQQQQQPMDNIESILQSLFPEQSMILWTKALDLIVKIKKINKS